MSYFIRIEDSPAIRRRVLESTKEILLMLKRYQLIINLREQKKEALQKITKLTRELNSEISQLQKIVPAEALKEIQSFLPKEKKKKTKAEKKKTTEEPEAKKEEKPKEKPERKKELTELEKLEQALRSIEEKLNSL